MTELKAKILTYIITILAVIFLRHEYIHKRRTNLAIRSRKSRLKRTDI